MDRRAWLTALGEALDGIDAWERNWPAIPTPTIDERGRGALAELTRRLTRDNYPFFHPRYAGQMLKPPHPVAWAAYATAMTINPNNHALDGGPPTAFLEQEAVAAIADMFGWHAHLGHLSASGTIANLEALWVCRELAGSRPILVGENAHYTHERMAQVLGVPVVKVPQTPAGVMDVGALRTIAAQSDAGTVVATLGTTGLGAVDPVHEIVAVAAEHGLRVHVDAAYGGFFALLARRTPPAVDPAAFAALDRVDSIVIDPHKHGLQPYGCGCVLFADPAVGRLYKHDSPYTYFSSAAHHPGEVTLECSRAGAAAAALWATIEAVPLTPHGGMGDSLAAGRRAALAWARRIDADPRFRLLVEPSLDIVVFAPFARGAQTASAVSARTDAVFDAGYAAPHDAAVYLAKIRIDRAQGEALWPQLVWDQDSVRVLRSVLMKAEHEAFVDTLHDALVRSAEAAD